MGAGAGFSIITAASNNLFFGVNSGYSITSGYNNLFFGTSCATTITTGHDGICLGKDTMLEQANSTDEYVCIGHNANAGISGVTIGYGANDEQICGQVSVIIGKDATSGGGSAMLVIGNGSCNKSATGNGLSSNVVLGITSYISATGNGRDNVICGTDTAVSLTTASKCCIVGNLADGAAAVDRQNAFGFRALCTVENGMFWPGEDVSADSRAIVALEASTDTIAVQYDTGTGQIGPASAALQLPVTAGEPNPGTDVAGQIGYDSNSNTVKFYNGTAWDEINNGTPVESSVTTTNATVTTIETVSVATSTTVVCIEVIIGAVRTDVTSEGAYYKISGAFLNNAGTVTQIDTTVKVEFESDATWDADFSISGTNVLVRVTGAAAKTINWDAKTSTITAA